MEKIKTIFERDWEGSRRVIDNYVNELVDSFLKDPETYATEKLDGMNVRATLRSGECVRLEKRRNPKKRQKAKGIVDPWYIDADINDPQDKWLFDALKNTDLKDLPDGEWSGEALGKNIQGNPLNLDKNMIVFFTLGQAPILENVPTTYNELKEWLPKQKSKLGNECDIEGVVWKNRATGKMYKIKAKDF